MKQPWTALIIHKDKDIDAIFPEGNIAPFRERGYGSIFFWCSLLKVLKKQWYKFLSEYVKTEFRYFREKLLRHSE